MSTKGNVGKEENVQTDDTAFENYTKNKAVFLQQQRQCIEDLLSFQADMMKEMKNDFSSFLDLIEKNLSVVTEQKVASSPAKKEVVQF